MPESDADYGEACRALSARWGVAPRAGDTGGGDYAYLLEVLTDRVSHLLAHRHQKLMASLYILDVSERRYNEAMSGKTHADRAAALARVILERETEKIASRRKYAKPMHEGLDDRAAGG